MVKGLIAVAAWFVVLGLVLLWMLGLFGYETTGDGREGAGTCRNSGTATTRGSGTGSPTWKARLDSPGA